MKTMTRLRFVVNVKTYLYVCIKRGEWYVCVCGSWWVWGILGLVRGILDVPPQRLAARGRLK